MAKHGKKFFSKKEKNMPDTYEYSDFGLSFNGEIDLGDEDFSTDILTNDTYQNFNLDEQSQSFDSYDSEPNDEPQDTLSKEEKKAQKAAEKKQKRISKEEQLIRKYEEELVRKGDKKKKGFKGFLKLIIPWKGDDAVELTRKFVLIVALAAFFVSAYILTNFAVASVQNSITNDKVKELYKNPNYDLTGVDFPEGANEADFAALYIQNNDTVGWIHIPNTSIDNVVVKTTDNDFYLTHDFYKKKSEHGAIMADFRTVFNISGNSKNVPLYGHHMKDGSMFAELEKFRTLSFYKQNPIIYFDTLYTKAKYEIFSVFITNDLESEDDGFRFNFNRVNFTSEEDFMDYITQVNRRSIFKTNVAVSPSDEILTLSTCVYDFNEARLVVCARRLLEGEQPADTSTAIRNPAPLYPQAWYDKKGGKKPVFNDASYVPPISNDTSSTGSVESTVSNSSDVSSESALPPIVSTPESTPSGTESGVTSDTGSNVTGSDTSTPSGTQSGGSSSATESTESSEPAPGGNTSSENTSGQVSSGQ
ncbi:MAG: class B sortase [Clostridia bacterium]|nr:class B sortase [Clostridia bacterium]